VHDEEVRHCRGAIAVSGEPTPIARGAARTRFFAACDGTETPIAMTGGNPYSLKHPKNVGHCDLTLTCYDQQNNPIANTSVTLKRGAGLLVYSCPSWTFKITLMCEDTDDRPSCILEVDD